MACPPHDAARRADVQAPTPADAGPADRACASSAGSPATAHAAEPLAPAAPAPRGRFAPTPSGRMHLGNVWCALVAWLAVRSAGGTLVLRIEDLDPRKTPAGATEALLDDLLWLGLNWDEGPVYQHDRAPLYEQGLQRLVEAGLTYPCFCSRAELHAAEAPHASDGTPLYAGTCKGLSPDRIAQKSEHRPPAIRLAVPGTGGAPSRAAEEALGTSDLVGTDETVAPMGHAVSPDGTVTFVDAVYGMQREALADECGDFLVRRSDGVHAYQLAVTVDDALMGINQVVRGRDLLPSTARQIYLQRLLGFSTPQYAHVPMLMATDGSRRLSKRERDCDLGFMREHFGRPEALLGRLAHLTGMRPTPEPVSAADLAQTFSWDAIRAHAAHDIPVPGSFFC